MSMSVKTVVKRDGTVQLYDPSKIMRWSLWAAKGIESFIDWQGVLVKVTKDLYDGVTTEAIQRMLIEECATRTSSSYDLLAGRLYSSLIRKQVFNGEPIPSVLSLHAQLIDLGMMENLDFTAEEYTAIESIIDHRRDFNLVYGQAKQLHLKYALSNKTTKKIFETPQFTAMRMAMTLAQKDPNKLQAVVALYDMFSNFRGSAPTPNYTNLGTPHRGFVSCCLYVAADDVRSIGVAEHVAYTMTYMSAGIGGLTNVRSIGDGVRNGTVTHQGKLPYFKSLGGTVNENRQGARGGASTQYISIFDPEIIDVIYLQNPRTPIKRQNRDLHFAVLYNDFFVHKVLNQEKIFVFNVHTAPDLMREFFAPDSTEFARLYAQYETNPAFKKTYMDAVDLITQTLNQSHEVATLYSANITEINRHTPFIEPIHSSNLCVSGNTLLLTDQGEFPIKSLVDQTVRVWNGKQWSETEVRRTGTNQDLTTVFLSSGRQLTCTSYHKWYIQKEVGDSVETPTKDLYLGDVITTYTLPDGTVVEGTRVIGVIEEGIGNTYCVTEPLEHKAVFNGVLTGQCLEITQPTKPYFAMLDLYDPEDRKDKGEVSLCALGGVIPSNIENDPQYEETAYNQLKMIDYCILNNHYVFPHLKTTALARMNAGVGIVGLAHYLAKRGLRYDSTEGWQAMHELAETHAYFLIKASLRLSKERGKPAYMTPEKSKWATGWLPIDSYKKTVDTIAPFTLRRDWEALRAEIIANGGIGHSSLVAHMPTESSSKAAKMPNQLYPIRQLFVLKTDDSNTIDFLAPDCDTIGQNYQLAYDVPLSAIIKTYAIFQKFCDQAISADIYSDRVKEPVLKASRLLEEFLLCNYYGLKTRYYTNSKTTKGVELSSLSSSLSSSDASAYLQHEAEYQLQAMQEIGGGPRGCGEDGFCTL
jgi:ribonucleotide reductase alpha subunit